VSELWASRIDGPETASRDDRLEATYPVMTATLVSEHRLRRQSSVLSPWRVPQARCIYREYFSFDVVSINQFSILVSIDPYIPTEVKKETGKGRARWKVRDLPVDERCVRPALDFLSTTDVGRWALPQDTEDDAVSAVSELEVHVSE